MRKVVLCVLATEPQDEAAERPPVYGWLAWGKINLKKRPHLLPGVHYRIPHSLQEIRALGRNMLEKDIF